MRISDWSSDVCSSDLGTDDVYDHLVGRDIAAHHPERLAKRTFNDGHSVSHFVPIGNPAATLPVHAHGMHFVQIGQCIDLIGQIAKGSDRRYIAIHGIDRFKSDQFRRSEEHTSELQSLMRISYAVFCLKKKKT